MTFDGLRGLMTRDEDWEVKENPFLYNPQHAYSTRKYQDQTETAAAEQNFKHHIFEIFHFEIFIEHMTTLKEIKNNSDKRYARELKVFPVQMRTSIELPLIMINLSIPTIYILTSLVTMWSSSVKGIQYSQVISKLTI